MPQKLPYDTHKRVSEQDVKPDDNIVAWETCDGSGGRCKCPSYCRDAVIPIATPKRTIPVYEGNSEFPWMTHRRIKEEDLKPKDYVNVVAWEDSNGTRWAVVE